MDEINIVMNAIMEPIGGRARSFLIDYRDDDNNYFSTTASVMQPPGVPIDPAELTAGLIHSCEAKGYTVYGIVELVDGCTLAQFEELTQHDPAEVRKHAVVVYMDWRKERTIT